MAAVEDDAPEVEIERVVELLGGQRVLHRRIRNRLEAHDMLDRGLPGQAVAHLIGSFTMLRRQGRHASLEKAVGVSLRTCRRRNGDPERRLSPEQSGRTWIFAEILARATALLGCQSAAEAWLDRPALALDRRKPIDLLSTPRGVQTIKDHLTRLEHGVHT